MFHLSFYEKLLSEETFLENLFDDENFLKEPDYAAKFAVYGLYD